MPVKMQTKKVPTESINPSKLAHIDFMNSLSRAALAPVSNTLVRHLLAYPLSHNCADGCRHARSSFKYPPYLLAKEAARHSLLTESDGVFDHAQTEQVLSGIEDRTTSGRPRFGRTWQKGAHPEVVGLYVVKDDIRVGLGLVAVGEWSPDSGIKEAMRSIEAASFRATEASAPQNSPI